MSDFEKVTGFDLNGHIRYADGSSEPESLQDIEDSSHSDLVIRVLNEMSANGKLKHAIHKALSDYARGRDIHEIMRELKEVEREQMPK